MKKSLYAILIGFFALSTARADDTATDPIPDNTLSPDKRYGVTVAPNENAEDAYSHVNNLVEMKTKRMIGEINSDTPAFSNMNHGELIPAWWSANDAWLLWQVDGKWGMETQILVHLKGSEIDWQLDVIKVLQRQILTRTEAADPKKFLAAKKGNWGDGSAYPEKLVFDSEPDNASKEPLKFPIHFHVYLASNVKQIDPQGVDSTMEATLNQDGEIKVIGFKMGRNKSAPWYETQTAQ